MKVDSSYFCLYLPSSLDRASLSLISICGQSPTSWITISAVSSHRGVSLQHTSLLLNVSLPSLQLSEVSLKTLNI